MSDPEEEMEDVEQAEEGQPEGDEKTAVTAKKPSTIKAKIIAGKEANTDVKAKSTIVLCNFYQATDGAKILEVPKLPPIITDCVANQPDDYEDYNGKLSSWYTETERRFKVSSKPVPVPKKDFKCIFPNCGWSFDTMTRLQRHRETHLDNGVFACQMCNSLFNHQYNIYMHWRNSCPPLSNRKTDADVTNGKAKNVRSFVLCMMGIENRAQQFHVFGGVIFIPSAIFLKDKNCSNHPSYQSTCYLCSLSVPTKFIECHGDVHRGRFRIDGAIYGEYYCHICSQIFEDKKNLINHWHTTCEEVKAYTPTEYYLNDEELTALAWLVMQQTIPEKHIYDMNPNSMQMLERCAQEHAIKNGLQGLFYNGGYYHYPQEIWPLAIPIVHDFINDCLPIKGKNISETPTEEDQLAYQVHPVNLMAHMCPEFYATGMTFTTIAGTPANPEDPKGVFKVILRYTIDESVIKTYTFNEKSRPRLKATALAWEPDGEESFCTQCNKNNAQNTLFFTSKGRCKVHMDKHANSKTLFCKICHRYLFRKSKYEHWLNGCEPLAELFPDAEHRKYCTEEFAHSVNTTFKNCRLKVNLVDKTALELGQESKKKTQFQSKDSIGHEIEVSLEAVSGTVEVNLIKARKHINLAFLAAKSNYELQQRNAEKFVPVTVTTVVCPHCGGIFHNVAFLTHLVNRHNYPGHPKDREKAVELWRKDKCRNTTEVFTAIIEESKKRYEETMPSDHGEKAVKPFPALLPAYQYEACCNAYKEGKLLKPFEHPWDFENTFRDVVLEGHLEIASIQNLEATCAPEPTTDWELIFPPSQKSDIPEDFMGKNGIVWRAADPKVSVPAREIVDPQTGAKLKPPLKAKVKAIDDVFFEDFMMESLTNGIDIISITEFFPKSFGNPKAANNTESDLVMQESATDEKVKSSLMEDALLQWYNSEEDDKDDGHELADRGSKLKEDSSDIRRKKKVRKARKKMKKESRKEYKTEVYDGKQFEPEEFLLDPYKINELKFLTRVDEVTSDSEDDEEPEGRVLPFNDTYERHWSDFGDNGKRFQKECVRKLQSDDGWIPRRKVNSSEMENAITDEQLDNSELQMTAIVDSNGVAYIGGFVHPMNAFGFKHHQTFFVSRKKRGIKEREEVKKYKTYECEDDDGKFVWFWPVDEQSNNEIEESFGLTRMEVTSYAPATYEGTPEYTIKSDFHQDPQKLLKIFKKNRLRLYKMKARHLKKKAARKAKLAARRAPKTGEEVQDPDNVKETDDSIAKAKKKAARKAKLAAKKAPKTGEEVQNPDNAKETDDSVEKAKKKAARKAKLAAKKTPKAGDEVQDPDNGKETDDSIAKAKKKAARKAKLAAKKAPKTGEEVQDPDNVKETDDSIAKAKKKAARKAKLAAKKTPKAGDEVQDPDNAKETDDSVEKAKKKAARKAKLAAKKAPKPGDEVQDPDNVKETDDSIAKAKKKAARKAKLAAKKAPKAGDEVQDPENINGDGDPVMKPTIKKNKEPGNAKKKKKKEKKTTADDKTEKKRKITSDDHTVKKKKKKTTSDDRTEKKKKKITSDDHTEKKKKTTSDAKKKMASGAPPRKKARLGEEAESAMNNYTQSYFLATEPPPNQPGGDLYEMPRGSPVESERSVSREEPPAKKTHYSDPFETAPQVRYTTGPHEEGSSTYIRRPSFDSDQFNTAPQVRYSFGPHEEGSSSYIRRPSFDSDQFNTAPQVRYTTGPHEEGSSTYIRRPSFDSDQFNTAPQVRYSFGPHEEGSSSYIRRPSFDSDQFNTAPQVRYSIGPHEEGSSTYIRRPNYNSDPFETAPQVKYTTGPHEEGCSTYVRRPSYDSDSNEY